MTSSVAPPWTVALTDGQHALIEYGVAVAAFCLVAEILLIREMIIYGL